MTKIAQIAKTTLRAINLIFTIGILCFGLLFTMPRLMEITPYVILSASMEPEIKTGAVVLINQRDKNVQVGDIIAFEDAEQSGKIVCHRIVDQIEDSYITKGDANDVVDLAPLSKKQIVGTYLIDFPGVGYLLDKKIPLLCLYAALNLLEFAIPAYPKKKNSV